MIKISSGNAAFDLGFMREMHMQGWTQKQASVILDYMLQHGNLDSMEKSASAGLVYEDPEVNPLFFMKWAAAARERYAWCNQEFKKEAFYNPMSYMTGPMVGPMAGYNMHNAYPSFTGNYAAYQQPQAPSTGSVEGDMQAGQEAGRQGGGFFSRMWNGVKNVGNRLMDLAPAALMSGAVNSEMLQSGGRKIADKLGGMGRAFSTGLNTAGSKLSGMGGMAGTIGKAITGVTSLFGKKASFTGADVIGAPVAGGLAGAANGGLLGAFLGALSGDGVAHGFNKGVNIGGGIGTGAGGGVALGMLLSKLLNTGENGEAALSGLGGLGGGILGGVIGHKLPTFTKSEKK